MTNIAKRRGSTLLITMLIVTLLASASIGAASSSFTNLRASVSYADGQIARDAAEAGIADLMKRLAAGSVPGSALVNLDLNRQEGSTSAKKAPYMRYYSFEPDEMIKRLGRCTKAAVISPWDPSTGTYLTPPNWDIFYKINRNNEQVGSSGGQSGIQGFSHPLTPRSADGNPVYGNDDPQYWLVKMGGPLDQWDPDDTALPSQLDRYSGLFSHAGYLDYDLLYFPLPSNRVLRLDDATKDQTEKWLLKGGRMWIDNTYLSGLVNGPFANGGQSNEYEFGWDYTDNRLDGNPRKAAYDISDTEDITSGLLKDDAWVLKDAFNQPTGRDDAPKWTKATIDESAQAINGGYTVRVIRSAPIEAVSYPGSAIAGDALAPDLSGNRIYIRYGSAKGIAIGDEATLYYQDAAGNINTDATHFLKGTVSDVASTVIGGKTVEYLQLGGFTGASANFSSHIGYSLQVTKARFGRTAGSAALTPGTEMVELPVASAQGFAKGDVIKITANVAGEGPLWGIVKSVNVAGGKLTIDKLRGGPTPRYGHSLVYNNDSVNPKAYLFGGYDLTKLNSVSQSSYEDDSDWPITNGSGSSTWPVYRTAAVRNDVWVLDLKTWRWEMVKDDTADSAPNDDRNNPVASPSRRAYAVAGYDGDGDGAGDTKKKLVVAFGEVANRENQVLSDVWVLDDLDASPLWKKVRDSEADRVDAGDASIPTDPNQLTQEVMGHDEAIYRVVDGATGGDVNITPNTTNFIYLDWSTATEAAGLAIGDEVVIDAGNYQRLYGTIKIIDYSGVRPKITFEKNLAGTGVSGKPSFSKVRHADAVVPGAPALTNRSGVAAGDYIAYTSSDASKQYWGTVKEMDPLIVFEGNDLFKGPLPRSRATGTYIASSNELYVFGGSTYSKKLNDTWKLHQAVVFDALGNSQSVWDYQDAKSRQSLNGQFAARVYSEASALAIGPVGSMTKAQLSANGITLAAGNITGIAIGDTISVSASLGADGKPQGGRLYGRITNITKSGSPPTYRLSVDSVSGIDITQAAGKAWLVEISSHAGAPSITQATASNWNNGTVLPTVSFADVTGMAIGDVLDFYPTGTGTGGSIYAQVADITLQPPVGGRRPGNVKFRPAQIASPLGRAEASLTADTTSSPMKFTLFGGMRQDGGIGHELWIGILGGVCAAEICWDKRDEWSSDAAKTIEVGGDWKGIPNDRIGASAVYKQPGAGDGSNRMVVWGGSRNSVVKSAYDSVWTLTNANASGIPTWHRTSEQPRDGVGNALVEGADFPEGRVGHGALAFSDSAEVSGYSMVVFGGMTFPEMHNMHSSSNELDNASNLPTDPEQVNKAQRQNITAPDGTFLRLTHSFFTSIFDKNYTASVTCQETGGARPWYCNYNLSNVLPGIKSLKLGANDGRYGHGESALTRLGNKFTVLSTYPRYPKTDNYYLPSWCNTGKCSVDYEENAGTFRDAANDRDISRLVSSAVAPIGSKGGMVLLTSNNVGQGISTIGKYYDEEQGEDTAFIFNAVIYFQSQGRIKVTGYYGGIARSFLVEYNKTTYAITDIVEVVPD